MDYIWFFNQRSGLYSSNYVTAAVQVVKGISTPGYQHAATSDNTGFLSYLCRISKHYYSEQNCCTKM